jgi:uncharacterized membrane protein (GlpM family)
MDLSLLQTKFLAFRVSQTKGMINETLASAIFHGMKSMMPKVIFFSKCYRYVKTMCI